MFTKTNSRDDVSEEMGEMGEIGSNHIFKMFALGKRKNSVGLKPNAEWKKDAKAPSEDIGSSLVLDYILSILK